MVRASETDGLRDLPLDMLASLCVAAGAANFWALAAMWGLMAAAMMLPTFVPALKTFLDLGIAGAATTRGAVALVGGYLALWLVASLGGAAAQFGLSRAGMLAQDGRSLSLWLNAALLTGAGLYQFSVLKAACLSKCRLPLTFFIERWRPGLWPALGMGWSLGLICLGCCWALMLLGFVGGTMNLMWMGAATAFMALEKMPEIGRWLTRPAGVLLIAAGAWTALGAAQLI
ncbi:MAG: DUF2182 domain-containing protein [Alphaproteobacteria bacterium]|nr:MAG: DUF2182 domain-containing protein [Alphaproteobacteria bacterium]